MTINMKKGDAPVSLDKVDLVTFECAERRRHQGEPADRFRDQRAADRLEHRNGNSMKTVTVTDNEGNVTEVNVADDDTARHFENLPFETNRIVSVDVKDA